MESAHAQVGVQLRLMRRQDGGNRFDLEDDLACNNDVSSEPLSDRHGFVDDRDGNLSFEWNAPFAQLMAQALLVNGLKRARTRIPMRLVGYHHKLRLPWPFVALRSSSVLKFNKA
jgi:hypothetical protein